MKAVEQVAEEGAYAALHTFRDRCPHYLPMESQVAWKRGFAGACLRILRETFGGRRQALPEASCVMQLPWRDRWRAFCTGRVEASIAGEVILVGELHGLAPEAVVRVDAPPIWATWQQQRAARRERRQKAVAEARAAAAPVLTPAEPATRTEP